MEDTFLVDMFESMFPTELTDEEKTTRIIDGLWSAIGPKINNDRARFDRMLSQIDEAIDILELIGQMDSYARFMRTHIRRYFARKAAANSENRA